MSGQLFFSTGVVARQLNTSPDTIRRLVAAGTIPSEITPGGQVRISSQVVEELRRTGLPSLPKPLPGDSPHQSPAGRRQGYPALLAEPSEEVIEAAEEVVVLENEVRALGLRRQKEEGLDWFRERERDEADRLAAEEREERARLAEEQAQREHDQWVCSWEAHAIDSVPGDAAPEVRLTVHEAVREKLMALDPMPTPAVTEQVVEALVARLLAPWRHEKKLLAVLIEARDTMLPVAARGSGNKLSQWQSRAIRAAGEAIRPLPTGASSEEIRATAKEAAAKVAAEFAHEQACQKMVAGVLLPGTTEEDEQARAAVKEALAQLPIGASEKQMEAARDAVTQPIREIIAERQAQERIERERNLAQAQAEWKRNQHDASKRAILVALLTAIPWDATAVRTPAVVAAVSQALDALPVGASRDELARARDQALEPHIAAHRQRQRKEQVIAGALREIYPCLVRLEESWDFEGETPQSLAQAFQKPVRAALEKRLTGNEPLDQLSKLVRQLVLRQLHAAPASALAR